MTAKFARYTVHNPPGERMKPYYEENGITIYHGDCREILPNLPKVDLVLTDPPYGVGNFVQVTGNVRGESVTWNDAIPTKDVFDMIKLVSKHRIIWGANYFNCFEPNGGTIVWKKNQPMPNFSKCEIASSSYLKKVELVEITWTNFVNTKQSCHPCERPVALYVWCINYIPNSNTILDPFMGSGTTLVAAQQLGRRAIGIEIERAYCDIAVNRLAQGVLNF